jgi:hypothetical protein
MCSTVELSRANERESKARVVNSSRMRGSFTHGGKFELPGSKTASRAELEGKTHGRLALFI